MLVVRQQNEHSREIAELKAAQRRLVKSTTEDDDVQLNSEICATVFFRLSRHRWRRVYFRFTVPCKCWKMPHLILLLLVQLIGLLVILRPLLLLLLLLVLR